jgi:hypothetical protein
MAEAHKESERKGVASFKGAEAAGASEEEQMLVTINAPTGKILRVEKIDKAAKRQELAEEDWAKLVGGNEVDAIEGALEQAFEAGVAAILGEEYDDEAYEDNEDDEEQALRRILIGGLLRRRPVQRRILQRVLLSRLLRRQLPKRPQHQ